MNYTIIEKFFEENDYQSLLDLYKEDFEKAEEYADLFTNNCITSPSECKEALDVLTGLYMKFNAVFHISEYEYERKKQLSKISTGDKDSLMSVACLRVKSLFKAYMDNAKKGILSSQSQLKFHIQEMNLTK